MQEPTPFELAILANGNPGAASVLALARTLPTAHKQRFFEKMEACKSIRGTNLWVLYSDLCGQDVTKLDMLCEFCPNDVLEDACSRQDYSGNALVAQYLGE